MRFLKTFAVVISVLIMAFVVYAGEMNCMHKMDMKCSSKMKDSDMKEMKTEVHKKMNMSNQAVKESKMDGNKNDIVACPVTGEKLKKKDAFAIYEYKGKKYYMCCDMCPKPFTTNPEKYIK